MSSDALLGKPNDSARIDSFVSALARFSVQRARVVLVASWIIALFSALLAIRLPVLGDFSHLLPPDAMAVRQLRLLEKRTRVLADYLIGVECNDRRLRAEAAADLRARLENIDRRLLAGITADHRVLRRFAWNNRYLFAPLTDLIATRDAVENEIDRRSPWSLHLDEEAAGTETQLAPLAALEDRLNKMKIESEDPGDIVSRDGHLQLLIVRTTFTSDDSIRGQELTAFLENAARLTERKYPGIRIGMTGDVINSDAEHRALLRGMLVSTLVTIVLVLAAILLFYRSWTGVGALAWSLCVAVLATFAFTRIAIGHLNLASAFLSSIVIGNGINFGLVYLARYVEERRSQPPNSEILVQAAVASARGTLTAAVAAAAAYGSLALTQFRGFRDFGIIGAVGMLLCWFTAYTVLPAGLSCLGPRIAEADTGWLTRLVARIAPPRFGSRIAIGISLLMVSTCLVIYYVTHDPFEDDLRNLRLNTPDLGEASRWMAKFDRAFGNGISGGFAIGVEDRTQAPAVVRKLKEVDEGKPANKRLFSQISSLDDLLPSDQDAKLAVLADLRKLLDSKWLQKLSPEQRQRLEQLRPPETLRALGDADVPQEVAWPYTERDGTRGKLILANTGLGVNTWRLHSLQAFAKELRGLELGPQVVIGGTAFVFSDMISMMRDSGPRATFVALVGSACVVLLLLGTKRHGIVALATAALGVLGMLSGACLLGIKVNFLDFVALPITIGVGVDYAVNICARARQYSTPNGGHLSVLGTGPVVVLCSYTTVVGYASLLFSLNRGIHTFGLCAMIGELTCLAAALVFAPAFLDWGTSRRQTSVGVGDSATAAYARTYLRNRNGR